MLHYTKMVEGSLIVLCLIVFIFLSDRGRLVQVLKKKGQLEIFSATVLCFPENLGKLGFDLY